MNAEREQELLTRARELVASTEDLAMQVTVILGCARAARLDPGVLHHLVFAALTLGASQLAVYTAGDHGEPAFADDTGFLTAVSDAEDNISDQLADTEDLRHDAAKARTAARADLDNARTDLGDARAMPVTRPCDGCHQARADAISDTREQIAACKERARLCTIVTRGLIPFTDLLERALSSIRSVPASLADTYEPVYEVRHLGHQMPKDGDFLTGQPS